jgi:predicted double-glycine peptidase
MLAAAANPPAAGEPTLSVPFLPQTEALCGGAAAAMVLRYLGDRHADVQQFAPLVDRRAGGIADTALVDALRTKGWTATTEEGTLPRLRAQLHSGQPAILLIEDRPGRYHYIVAVGIGDTDVLFHDPTWGPNRRMPLAAFETRWRTSHHWMLVVSPGKRVDDAPHMDIAQGNTSTPRLSPPTPCRQLLDDALDDIAAHGLSVADAALGRVRAQCPEDAGPLRELAGVRFAQSRWSDAASLAREALTRDATDTYAWDVLGSTLFMQHDLEGALAAWNHINKPQLDSVRIDGLMRARYALVAAWLGLEPNTLLTPRDFALANRRLEQLPDRITSRLTFRPDPDGFAIVDAALLEGTRGPHHVPEWVAAGAQTAINREVAATIPGWSGQGDVWSARWRWWEHRPMVAASFAAPVSGRLAGIWRVDGAWEEQTYDLGAGVFSRETRKRGGLAISNWLTPQLRYEVHTGIDAWDRDLRTLSFGGTLERRLLDDRVSMTAEATRWSAPGAAEGFAAASLSGWFRSSKDSVGLVFVGQAQIDVASRTAPLALWSGAGEGQARPALLRAHRVMHDGIVDGPIFGRRVSDTNLELQRWFGSALAPIGIAVFTDIAHAADRLPSAIGKPLQVDAGVGLRIRMPGRESAFRLDYGRGLRDGAHALTVGWTSGPR